MDNASTVLMIDDDMQQLVRLKLLSEILSQQQKGKVNVLAAADMGAAQSLLEAIDVRVVVIAGEEGDPVFILNIMRLRQRYPGIVLLALVSGKIPYDLNEICSFSRCRPCLSISMGSKKLAQIICREAVRLGKEQRGVCGLLEGALSAVAGLGNLLKRIYNFSSGLLSQRGGLF